MAVVDALESRYGNSARPSHLDSVARLGNEYLDRAFPGLDRIVLARILGNRP